MVIFGICLSIASACIFDTNHALSIFSGLAAIFCFVFGAAESVVKKLKK